MPIKFIQLDEQQEASGESSDHKNTLYILEDKVVVLTECQSSIKLSPAGHTRNCFSRSIHPFTAEVFAGESRGASAHWPAAPLS